MTRTNTCRGTCRDCAFAGSITGATRRRDADDGRTVIDMSADPVVVCHYDPAPQERPAVSWCSKWRQGQAGWQVYIDPRPERVEEATG